MVSTKIPVRNRNHLRNLHSGFVVLQFQRDDRSPPRYRDDRRRYDDYDYDRRDDWRTPRGKGARTTATLFDGPMLTYKQFLEIQDEGISPNEAGNL